MEGKIGKVWCDMRLLDVQFLSSKRLEKSLYNSNKIPEVSYDYDCGD